MIKDKFSEFINTYKEIESICRDMNVDYKTIEDQVDPDKQNKMRMCRQFRNYIQHVNGYKTFLTISDEMLKFLRELKEELELKGDIVKQHIGKINLYSCTSNDKCGDILALMNKRKITEYLVIDEVNTARIHKRDIKVINIFDLADMCLINKNKKIKDLNKYSNNYSFASPNTKMEDIPSGNIICTDDGTKDGKLLGIIK